MRRRDDNGVVIIEFALVSVVFFALVFGGLFVILDAIAKGQATSQTSAAATFVAVGGCPTTTTTSPPATTPCADGNAPPPSCTNHPQAELGTTTTLVQDPNQAAVDAATLATICEVGEILGNALTGTDAQSLQVALYCSRTDAVVTTGVSQESCSGARAVWVCVRAWDPLVYPGIESPHWISSASEQIVTTVPAAATTTTTGTGTTTTAPPALNQLETFYPATPTSQPWSNTPDITCGPKS